MKKAIRVCSILCIALLLVGIMSCSNGSEPDTWTRVTNLNELQGTWEGATTYTEEYPIDEAGNTTNISMTVTMQVQYPVDGTNGKGLKLVSITDMTNVIDELVSLYGSQPSGGVSITADYLWEEIKNTTEMICTPFSGQTDKGVFLCISTTRMNTKSNVLKCTDKAFGQKLQNISKIHKIFIR